MQKGYTDLVAFHDVMTGWDYSLAIIDSFVAVSRSGYDAEDSTLVLRKEEGQKKEVDPVYSFGTCGVRTGVGGDNQSASVDISHLHNDNNIQLNS